MNTGRVHDLKTWPEPYTAILDGRKHFEIRQDDRGYAVGDILLLKEFDPSKVGFMSPSYVGFTGREIRAVVTYMVPGGAWGLPSNLCVMNIRVLEPQSSVVPDSTKVACWSCINVGPDDGSTSHTCPEKCGRCALIRAGNIVGTCTTHGTTAEAKK